MALLNLLNKMDESQYEISLYVMLKQGELIEAVPSKVHVLNTVYSNESVMTEKGRATIKKNVLRDAFYKGNIWHLLPYMIRNSAKMLRRKKFDPEKIVWRMIADAAPVFHETYDLAVAYLEGASTYYVAEHVQAKKKAAFIHIDYGKAGYTKDLDQNCYDKIDRIFTVSDETKTHFEEVYPEYANKVFVFHNIIDEEDMKRKAKEKIGFADIYDGTRLLTVARLTEQKGYEYAIEALSLMKKDGYRVRWYALGEGALHEKLEQKIESMGLKEDFILLGAVKNPYPYYRQADIYMHMTRFEGKSIAIQEAQTLGKPIIASDCSGNREQIKNNVDGILCPLDAYKIAEMAEKLITDPALSNKLAENAAQIDHGYQKDWDLLFDLTK